MCIVFFFSHQIQRYVDDWLARHFPQVRRWQYDDNSGERSINLFHVHVFIEMVPFAFTARPDLLYLPPHLLPPPAEVFPEAEEHYEEDVERVCGSVSVVSSDDHSK